jgi:SAM-dependent methyltransferase
VPRSWADRHARFYGTVLGRRVLDVEVQLLLGTVPERGVAASVGCGLALHEVEVARRRPELTVIGMDEDPGMLHAIPAGMPAVLGDAESLPFRDGALDCLFYVTSLEFCRSPDRALDEAARALRTGGSAVVLGLNPVSDWGRERLHGVKPPWRTAEELGATLSRHLGSPSEAGNALRVDGDHVGIGAARADAVLFVATAKKSA